VRENSKPLLVSELVGLYKGMRTSTPREPEEQLRQSSHVVSDYANTKMLHQHLRHGTGLSQTAESQAKNYTIMEESMDEQDVDKETPKRRPN